MVGEAKKKTGGWRLKLEISDSGWRLVAGFAVVAMVVFAELVALRVRSPVAEIEGDFATFQTFRKLRKECSEGSKE